jgi:hypothetical protein
LSSLRSRRSYTLAFTSSNLCTPQHTHTFVNKALLQQHESLRFVHSISLRSRRSYTLAYLIKPVDTTAHHHVVMSDIASLCRCVLCTHSAHGSMFATSWQYGRLLTLSVPDACKTAEHMAVAAHGSGGPECRGGGWRWYFGVDLG